MSAGYVPELREISTALNGIMRRLEALEAPTGTQAVGLRGEVDALRDRIEALEASAG